MRQVALYTRVSTDRQTTENRERELRAIAVRAGWAVVHARRVRPHYMTG
jgi:DNA invertase Pin-like site-specific DNA recombinase